MPFHILLGPTETSTVFCTVSCLFGLFLHQVHLLAQHLKLKIKKITKIATTRTELRTIKHFTYVSSIRSVVHVGVAGILHLHGSLSFGEDIPPYISKHFGNLYPSEALYEASHILQGAFQLRCTPCTLSSGQ